jgi:hypothetical protein
MNTGVPKRKASASFGSNAPWLNHKPSEFATRVKRDRCNTPAPYNYNGFKNNKKQVEFNNDSTPVSISSTTSKTKEISRFNKAYKITTPKISTKNGITYYN